jgi:hypothetical protein
MQALRDHPAITAVVARAACNQHSLSRLREIALHDHLSGCTPGIGHERGEPAAIRHRGGVPAPGLFGCEYGNSGHMMES